MAETTPAGASTASRSIRAATRPDTAPPFVATTVSDPLRAPFPYFGGKRRVAADVWERFGDVASYNEPFAGSLAVLLGRPHEPRIETVNDLDAYIANFWRAVRFDPDSVAFWADSPVNETDLHARHRWLVQSRKARASMAMVKADPDYFDAKIAGWWVWGQCLWIGSGWCADIGKRNERPHEQQKRFRTDGDSGVMSQFDRNGQGTVHQQRRPHLTRPQGAVTGRRWQGGGKGGGSGVHAPRLTEQQMALTTRGGRGIHSQEVRFSQQKPQLSGDGSGESRGLLSAGVRSEGLTTYMFALAERLRRVRVCCGDWSRVLSPSVTTYIGVTGVFLDPPYAHDLRERCYSEDHDISADVRTWALAHGDDPMMRIALCGYEGEHKMPASWDCVKWKAHGGYSRSERGVANRERERIWFSPHCLRPGGQLVLPSE